MMIYRLEPCGLKILKKIFSFSNFFLTFFSEPIIHLSSLGGFQGQPQISEPAPRIRSPVVDTFFVGITTDRVACTGAAIPVWLMKTQHVIDIAAHTPLCQETWSATMFPALASEV